MSEVWRSVVGYEGLYEVSDHGRVRSLERTAFRKNGTPLLFKAAMKKICVNAVGYPWTRLTRDGISTNVLVHRMVAEAFIPNPDKLNCVNHKDLTPTNNSVGNLEWVSHRQNIVHARDGGRMNGWTNPNKRYKLQPEQVADIRARASEPHSALALKHGVSRRMVTNIVNDKRWARKFDNARPGA